MCLADNLLFCSDVLEIYIFCLQDRKHKFISRVGVFFLPLFLSLLSFSRPAPPFLPSFCHVIHRSPQIRLGDLGECCKLFQRDLGGALAKTHFVVFRAKTALLVAGNVVQFLSNKITKFKQMYF